MVKKIKALRSRDKGELVIVFADPERSFSVEGHDLIDMIAVDLADHEISKIGENLRPILDSTKDEDLRKILRKLGQLA